MEVFHGTTKENANNILATGFETNSKDPLSPNGMINDLGNGVYSYCDDENELWNPKDNAVKYARTYRKNGQNKFSVLKITINESSTIDVLDMDDADIKVIWAKLVDKLTYRANQIYKNVPNTRSKRRHNIDGILLELAIYYKKIPNPDIILKETYTAFEKDSLSNFANGRECAIRNLDVIVDTKNAV